MSLTAKWVCELSTMSEKKPHVVDKNESKNHTLLRPDNCQKCVTDCLLHHSSYHRSQQRNHNCTMIYFSHACVDTCQRALFRGKCKELRPYFIWERNTLQSTVKCHVELPSLSGKILTLSTWHILFKHCNCTEFDKISTVCVLLGIWVLTEYFLPWVVRAFTNMTLLHTGASPSRINLLLLSHRVKITTDINIEVQSLKESDNVALG